MGGGQKGINSFRGWRRGAGENGRLRIEDGDQEEINETRDKIMNDRIKICHDNGNHTRDFYCRITAKPRNARHASNKNC